MKKFLALLLAAMMVLAMVGSAFAEDGDTPAPVYPKNVTTTTVMPETNTYVLTINNPNPGHVYAAYQILGGNLVKETVKTYDSAEAEEADEPSSTVDTYSLTEIRWGLGVSAPADVDATAFAESLTDANVLEKVGSLTLADASASSNYDETNKVYKITGLKAGYYIVKDMIQEGGIGDDAYSSYIIKIVKDVNMAPKSAKPTVDKQVQDEIADAEEGADAEGWGESADHQINESFQFKLIATLTADADYASYETYALKFNDSMDAGVTFESIASVTVGTTTLTADQYECTATAGQAGGTWSLTIEDIKPYVADLTAGCTVTVVYNAHLNEAAKISTPTTAQSNNNKVDLQYSNNPNVGGEGSMGQTPEDTVFVFTYRVDNTKYADEAADGNELAGAEFVLKTSAGATVALIFDEDLKAYRPVKSGETAVDAMVSGDDGMFNIVGLDVGTYTLHETKAPAGYNLCDDITIKITATHKENATGTAATLDMTNSSNLDNDIVDKAGSTLPETGSIGTTIFYVMGSVLVLCAVVLLVTRRRMAAK